MYNCKNARLFLVPVNMLSFFPLPFLAFDVYGSNYCSSTGEEDTRDVHVNNTLHEVIHSRTNRGNSCRLMLKHDNDLPSTYKRNLFSGNG